MTALHHPFDHFIFALLLLFPIIELRWTWPRYLAQLAAGVPRARLNFYRSIVLEEWIAVAVLLGYWACIGRPLQALMLIPASPVRFAIGMAVALALCALLMLQNKAIRARPDVMPRLRKTTSRVWRTALYAPTPAPSDGAFTRFQSPPASAKRCSSAAFCCGISRCGSVFGPLRF